jgi:hypothetical protein
VADPVAKLDVRDDDATVYSQGPSDTEGQFDAGATLFIQNLNETVNAFSQILFTTRTNSVGRVRLVAIGTGTNSSMFAIGIENSGTMAEVIRIDSAGRVGIGTNNPVAALEIAGATGELLKLNDSSATGSPYISFNQSGTRRGYIQQNDGNDVMYLSSDYGEIRLRTAAGGSSLDRLTVDEVGNVGIGTTSPNASALLDLSSTTGALLLPRMTTDQRNAFSPIAVDGMLIYNSTLNKLQGHENGGWRDL